MSAQSFRLRCDLSGSLANAIDALNGEKGWTHSFRDPPGEEERGASVATLEMVRDHIADLRAGKVSLQDFADFYCLTPLEGVATTGASVGDGRRERSERGQPNQKASS